MGNDGFKSYFSRALGEIRVPEEISSHSAQSQVGLVSSFCWHDYIHPVMGNSPLLETVHSILRQVDWKGLSYSQICRAPNHWPNFWSLELHRKGLCHKAAHQRPEHKLSRCCLYWSQAQESALRSPSSGRAWGLSGRNGLARWFSGSFPRDGREQQLESPGQEASGQKRTGGREGF